MNTQPDEDTSDSQASKPSDPPSRPPVLSYATPQPSDNNSAAVWAMVCAISFFAVVWLGIQLRFFGTPMFFATAAMAIAAIVLGHMGMSPTGPQAGRGLAKAAFLLGCLFLALLYFGYALKPGLSASKPRADIVKCTSNLRQLGQGLEIYANGNNGRMPPDLGVLVATVGLYTDVLVCPASGDTPATGPTTQAAARNAMSQKGHCSYVYLGAGLNKTSITPDHVLIYDNSINNHENWGMNFLYGDGHVDWLPRQAALALLAELQAGHNPPRPPASTTRP